MRSLVTLGQRWERLEDDTVWVLRQIHRKDGLVRLELPGVDTCFVTFGQLGSQYALLEEEP